MTDIKICECGWIKESAPTPEGDEICPNCGNRECLDLESEDISWINSREK